MYVKPSEMEAKPEDPRMDAALLRQARDFALTGGGSGRIIRHCRLVMQWGDQKHLYDLKSSTKGIGITALGGALRDGKIKGLDDMARQYHPDFGLPPEFNAQTGWLDKITLFHLATQTAGFHKPGGYMELLFEPGTKWLYSDGGPNWLAECITLAELPRDAYWTWGLYDSLIVVIPSLDMVVARAGESLNKARNSHYRAIAPLLEPIARA